MNILQRNASNQLGELAEILSDYEMMRYYNPYYHEWRMQELHDDKMDLYYKSAGTTDFDAVIGIKYSSMSIERIGEGLIGIGEQIERAEGNYREHRQILNGIIKDWQDEDLSLLTEYFRLQLSGDELIIECVEELKRTLYHIERNKRNERNKVVEELQRIETEKKARELKRKREKLHRRYGVTTQFTPGYYDEIGTKL